MTYPAGYGFDQDFDASAAFRDAMRRHIDLHHPADPVSSAQGDPATGNPSCSSLPPIHHAGPASFERSFPRLRQTGRIVADGDGFAWALPGFRGGSGWAPTFERAWHALDVRADVAMEACS